MSMISKLGKAFTTPQAKQAAQKAKMYLNTSEFVAQGKKLINCPAADTFIASAKKQGATIVSDMTNNYGTRFITKRLPSGTTVCKVFSNGKYWGKEVISKKAHSLTQAGLDPSCLRAYVEKNNGTSIFKRAGSVFRSIVPQDYGYVCSDLKSLDGITAKVNKGNELYNALKNAEKIC